MTIRYGIENASRTRASRRLLVAVLVASLLSPAPVQAVQVAPDRPAEDAAMGDDWKTEVPSEAELERARQFHLMSVYAMELRRVQAAVSLEDTQRTKLDIGAKGLAKKRAKEFVQLIKKMVEGTRLAIGDTVPESEPAKDEPAAVVAPIKSLAEIHWSVKSALVTGFNVQSRPCDDAEWMKVVKASVTPAQFAQYEQFIAASKLKVDTAMVGGGVAILGDDLALTPDQQDKLRSLIVEQRAQAKDDPGFTKGYVEALPREDKRVLSDLAKVEPSKLQSILSPPQFEKLNLTLQILNSIGEFMDDPGLNVPVGEVVNGIGLSVTELSEAELGGAKQYQLLNFLAVEIGRIDAAVKLDDSQQSRLSAGMEGLALQGALEFLRNGGMRYRELVEGRSFAATGESQAAEPPRELKRVERYAAVDALTKLVLVNRFLPQPEQRENADWLRLVHSVLTPEQAVQYEQALAAQERLKYQAMVAAGMATLSVDLALSEEQEGQLVDLIMAHGAQLKPPYGVLRTDAAVCEHQAFFYEIKNVNAEAIGQILDPQQFDLLGLYLAVFQ